MTISLITIIFSVYKCTFVRNKLIIITIKINHYSYLADVHFDKRQQLIVVSE